MSDNAPSSHDDSREDGDLSEMLEELRVLLPGTTTLTAFLIILPFNGGFSEIRNEEKGVYAVTFICSLVALVLFTAPAVHHRLQRPLRNRDAFKNTSTRFMIAGMISLSVALVLVTQLVLSTVFGGTLIPWSISGVLAILIVLLWWLFPRLTRHDEPEH